MSAKGELVKSRINADGTEGLEIIKTERIKG